MKVEKRAFRVLIVDDHPVAREGLAFRISLQSDFELCGEAIDVADALERIHEQQPDVVVVDIALRTGSGIDLIKRVKSHYPDVRMLAWSMHDESLYAERALRAGALGYIDKAQSTDKVVEAIRSVLSGKMFVSGQVAERLLQRSVHGHAPHFHSPVEVLSDRELEAFNLIGQGLDTQEVAKRMHVTTKTVDTYRSRIKDKLNVRNRAELVRLATLWTSENR
jgi:DNA-binding NarL/FixJ family response regulator